MERDDCHGQCLIRIASGQHVRWRACAFSCVPRKCANHVICGQWEAQTILDEHDGACRSCIRRFGKKLDIVEKWDPDVECAVCYEPMVVAPCLPQCTHRFCVDCFRALNKVPAATDASNGHDVLEAVPAHSLSWTDANTDQAASAACPMCRAKHWLWRRAPVLRPMVVMGVPRFNPNPDAADPEEMNMDVEPRHTVSLAALNAKLFMDAKAQAQYERASVSNGWENFRLEHEREWMRGTNVAGPPRAIGLHEWQPDQYVYVADAAPPTHVNTSPGAGVVHERGNHYFVGTFPPSPSAQAVEPPLDEQHIVRALEKTYIKAPNGAYLATPNSLLALLGTGREGVEKRGDHVVFTDESIFNAVFEESRRKMARRLGIPIGAQIVPPSPSPQVVVPPKEELLVRNLEKTYIKTPMGTYLVAPNTPLALLGAGREGVETRGDHVVSFTDEATFNAVLDEARRHMMVHLPGNETHIPIGTRIVNTKADRRFAIGRRCPECCAPGFVSCPHRDRGRADWHVQGGDTVSSPTPGDIRWEIRDPEEHIRHIRHLRDVRNGVCPLGEKDESILRQHLNELEATEEHIADVEHVVSHPRLIAPRPLVPVRPNPAVALGARQQMEDRRAYADSLLASIRARRQPAGGRPRRAQCHRGATRGHCAPP